MVEVMFSFFSIGLYFMAFVFAIVFHMDELTAIVVGFITLCGTIFLVSAAICYKIDKRYLENNKK